MVQFVGIPFAFAFGQLAERLGAKPSLFIALAVYTSHRGRRLLHDDDLGVLPALVNGGHGAGRQPGARRSLFATMIPRHKSSEFFGFFGVFEKFAGILGPALFAVTTAATGSSRSAVLAVVFFFVAGGAVLTKVNVHKGQMTAASANARGDAE